MSERFHQPELDALRFFAFVAVFCDHISFRFRWWPAIRDAGSSGMSLFFLLSAYLIVTLLLREQTKTGTIDIRAFFIRRALRIWPLYFSLLLLALIMGHFLPTAHIPGGAIAAMFLMVGNVWVAHHGFERLVWTIPMWSLSIEEQFYLGIPALTRSVSRRTLGIIFVLVLLLAYATLTLLAWNGRGTFTEMWVNSFVQFQFFAAGGLIALHQFGKAKRLGLWARLALIITGLFCWFLAATTYGLHGLTHTLGDSLCGYGMVLVGTVALFYGVLHTSVKFPASVLYLGKITYGMYMFHYLMLWVTLHSPLASRFPGGGGVRTLTAGVLTVAVASFSYEFLERPFLGLKYRFERVHSRPA